MPSAKYTDPSLKPTEQMHNILKQQCGFITYYINVYRICSYHNVCSSDSLINIILTLNSSVYMSINQYGAMLHAFILNSKV